MKGVLERDGASVLSRHRRLRLITQILGASLIMVIVLSESNTARLAAVAGLALLSVTMMVLVLRASRCRNCGAHLSTKDVRVGNLRIVLPWYFRRRCRRCGWDSGSGQGAEPEGSSGREAGRM